MGELYFLTHIHSLSHTIKKYTKNTVHILSCFEDREKNQGKSKKIDHEITGLNNS